LSSYSDEAIREMCGTILKWKHTLIKPSHITIISWRNWNY